MCAVQQILKRNKYDPTREKTVRVFRPQGRGTLPMSKPIAPEGSHALPQSVAIPLTRAAIFLVVTAKPGAGNRGTIRSFCADLAALVRSVGFRELEGSLSCVLGFGSEAWDRLFGQPRPAELHKFHEIRAGERHAVSTPGDMLFHIRAQRMDLCFELATRIMARLGSAISPVDEVHGFRFFDSRDLIGFVDGTENPKAQEALDVTLIADEDPAFTAGSYVIVQKYLHNLADWNRLPTEKQEHIVGRTKLTDVELDDSVKPPYAHDALTKIVQDEKEVKILRDNMPFGHAGQGEFGTYFIGYSRSPRTIEQMLQNMFVGKPPGNYDRLLDFSRAVTGNLFFIPSATFLEDVRADWTGTLARNLSADRVFALAASCSRFFGCAFVSRERRRLVETWAICSTAAENECSFAFDGWLNPLIFLTNCMEASRISSSVAGGSKLNRVLIFLHISQGLKVSAHLEVF